MTDQEKEILKHYKLTEREVWDAIDWANGFCDKEIRAHEFNRKLALLLKRLRLL